MSEESGPVHGACRRAQGGPLWGRFGAQESNMAQEASPVLGNT